MSEKKSPRDLNEITNEYQNVALRAGVLQYELKTKQKDLDAMNDTMRNLNLEYAQSKELADKVAEKVAAEKAKEAAEQKAPEADKESK